jgi:hypothetical protein
MPRIRTLKPEFWTDEKLAPLPPITRLVFLGLISLADDTGRLIDNVKSLDGMLFPETDDTCRESLEVLMRLSRISRYVAESGQKVIQITNWASHQKVAHPSPHNLPGPPVVTSDPATISAALMSSSRGSHENLVPLPTTNDQRPVPTTNDQKPAARSVRFDPLTVDLPVELQTDQFRTAWRELCEHRASKRKPVTKMAAPKLIAKCARAGPVAAVKAIEDAIANDWQGIFPEKESTNGHNGNRTNSRLAGPGVNFEKDSQPAGGIVAGW